MNRLKFYFCISCVHTQQVSFISLFSSCNTTSDRLEKLERIDVEQADIAVSTDVHSDWSCSSTELIVNLLRRVADHHGNITVSTG